MRNSVDGPRLAPTGHPMRNGRRGTTYPRRSLHGQVAHEIGLRIMRGELPPITDDGHGHPVRGPWYFAVSSPESRDSDTPADAFQALGRPQVWQGVLSNQGTYYLEVFNDSSETLNYTLTISGPNLDLSPDAPSPPDLGPGPLPKTTPRRPVTSNSGG